MSSDDLVDRGNKGRNVAGTATFVGLRALDPFLQYGILGRGVADNLLALLGTSALAQGPTTNTGIALLDNLELSPYRLILLSMAVGSSAKHIIWKLFIGEEAMAPGPSAMVGVFNTIFNSINSLLFVSTATSLAYGRGEGPYWQGWPGLPLQIGSVLFGLGVTTELVSEFQRKAFKGDPANKGKPHTSGLFGLARHINYAGYTLWRAGFALASGGWAWGLTTGAFFAYDFSARAIPILDKYCTERYGAAWQEYKRQTPYILLPFVF